MTSRLRRRRNEGGYIMLVVMATIVALMVTAIFVYRSSEDQLLMTVAVRNQNIANMRAAFGAKRVIADVNSGVLPSYLANFRTNYTACQVWSRTVPTSMSTETLWPCCETSALCGGSTTSGCVPTPLATMPLLDNGNSLELDATPTGGGSQYEVQLLCIRRPGKETSPSVLVRSFGYYGYNPATRANSTRYMDVVEVEADPNIFQTSTGNNYGNVGQ